jgi:radical SAM superfamily enzyme YgiQ (UPF0313 family)
MNVVLVHGKYFNSWEALGLGYIAAYVKRHEAGVRFAFFQGSFDAEGDILAACAGADILAFSCTTPTANWAEGLARRAKEANPGLRVVMGGYHASAVGYAALTVEGIDQVVVGEGETAMLEIVRGEYRMLVRGSPLEFEDLPWPDRGLIRNERNIALAARENAGCRITSFQAHRGCPFKCAFCGDGALKVMGGAVRCRDAGDLLDEIGAVGAEYGLDYFKFCDATWNSRLDWVIGFCEEKIRRGLKLPYFANLHASVVTQEMMRLMALSECRDVAFGIESGSDRVLQSCGKGITTDAVRRSVRTAKEAGLRVRGYFLIGLPDEEESDLEETEALAEALDLDVYGFTILCPYPGSAYYQENVAAYADIEWEDEYHNDFWRSRAVSNERLREWQARLTAKFSDRLTQRQPKVHPCVTRR